MTNEEAVIVDLKCIMNCLISEDLFSIEPIEKSINLIQENTKLKAEIEELKEDISQLNGECAELDNENKSFKTEIEQLKAMLKAKDVKQDFSTYCELRNQNEELISKTIKLKSEVERYKKLIPKMCENCEYEDLLGYEYPCENCTRYSKWKLKCEVSNE